MTPEPALLNTLLHSFPRPRGKEAWPHNGEGNNGKVTDPKGKLFSVVPTVLLPTSSKNSSSVMWLEKRNWRAGISFITAHLFSDRANGTFHILEPLRAPMSKNLYSFVWFKWQWTWLFCRSRRASSRGPPECRHHKLLMNDLSLFSTARLLALGHINKTALLKLS